MTDTWADDASDTAFLDDLLAFVDASEDALVTNKRRGTPARKSREKRELDQLQAEAQQLTMELERLRIDAGVGSGDVRDQVLVERHRRRRAERECQQLRSAVYAQTRFLRGLRSMFSGFTPLSAALNLCRYLHNYTRLSRDRSTRLNEYAALAQETRMQVAMDMLWRETQSIAESTGVRMLLPSLQTPHINTEVLRDAHGFGVTTTSVYAVDTTDLSTVLRAAYVAVRDIILDGPEYRCIEVKRTQIEDPNVSAPNQQADMPMILYNVMGVQQKCHHNTDEVLVETRIVTMCKQTANEVMMLWDFVDDDELNPTMETTHIMREPVGACMIRREMCDDGVERAVCRFLDTRYYRFHTNRQRELLIRYQEACELGAHANAIMFRRILMQEVAKEQALLVDAIAKTRRLTGGS